jgi:hypothetical protein
VIYLLKTNRDRLLLLNQTLDTLETLVSKQEQIDEVSNMALQPYVESNQLQADYIRMLLEMLRDHVSTTGEPLDPDALRQYTILTQYYCEKKILH